MPNAVLEALRRVRDPDLGKDIVELGFVQNLKTSNGKVSLTIELTTPACPVRDELKEQARRIVAALPGVREVEITMSSRVRPSAARGQERILSGVKNVIPIASGKGGVGKSTVSANLALALARAGGKVGLLDADVYGPSIPLIMGSTQLPRQTSQARLIPVEKWGIRMMSLGYLVNESDAIIWRGPMLHKMMDQLLEGVEWGELDYLIVDLPPGTGDIQLSLCQKIPLTGAVIVSTPQDAALKVAEKAITMFRQLRCPILGLVENMSHYVCRHCGERDDIFSHGGAKKACDRLGLPFLGEIPLATAVCEASDRGTPTVVAAPDSSLAKAFLAVAGAVAAQVSTHVLQAEISQPIQINF